MRNTSHRKEKLPEALQQLAAEFVEMESNRTSLITITGVRLSADQKRADILFTVLPETQEKAVSDFLSRKVLDLKRYVQEKSRIGRIPLLSFALDTGEKNRQRIDSLLSSD